MGAAKGTALLAILLFAWTLRAPRAQAVDGYLDVAIDVIQVKLNDEAAEGVTEEGILASGAGFKARFDALGAKGKATVLARFRSGLTVEEPARLAAMRKIVVVTPASFEDKEYPRFLTEEVGSSMSLSALKLDNDSGYAFTLKGTVGNVVGWMKDGNPVVVEGMISGTRVVRAGDALVFSIVVAGDDREMDRDPVRDFTTEAAEDSLTRPTHYQFVVIVTLQ